MPSGTAEAVATVEAVEEAVEDTAEIVVVEVAAKTKIKTRIKIKPLGELPSIRGLNIRICQPENGPGVVCISVGAGLPSSVPNREHVLGKMFLLRSNETVTSSVNMT